MRKWLKELRIKKGLTGKITAAAAGISEPFYNQIENGKRNPSVPVAKMIAKSLGVPWEKFYE